MVTSFNIFEGSVTTKSSGFCSHVDFIWGVLCQKQVSRARTSDYMSQYLWQGWGEYQIYEYEYKYEYL